MTQTVKLAIRDQQNLFFATQVGTLIGNINMIAALFDESWKYWDRARSDNNGEHIIAGVVLNNERKTQAISDYAAMMTGHFMDAKYPTLALYTKRGLSLAAEHRKEVIFRMSGQRFEGNEQLFKALFANLMCFDADAIDAAITGDKELKVRYFTKLIYATLGDFLTDSDWSPLQEEMYELLRAYNVFDRREEFVNALITETINGAPGRDFDFILESVLRG